MVTLSLPRLGPKLFVELALVAEPPEDTPRLVSVLRVEPVRVVEDPRLAPELFAPPEEPRLDSDFFDELEELEELDFLGRLADEPEDKEEEEAPPTVLLAIGMLLFRAGF